MTKSLIALVAAACSLAGCATVESKRFGPAAVEGIPYNLPRGSLQLTITDTEGALQVSIGGPILTPDAAARLTAKLPRSGIADNKVTITIDPKTNLLQKIDATSIGRLDDIFKKGARSLAFQGSESAAGTTIFRKLFDEENVDTVVDEANQALAAYFRSRCVVGRATAELRLSEAVKLGLTGTDRQAALRKRLLHCAALEEAGLSDGASGIPTVIQIKLPAEPEGAGAARIVATATDAQCRRGICYRPFRAQPVIVRLGEFYSQSDVFLMPDMKSLMYVDLASGVFADQKYILEFTGGVLTSYQQDAQSEILGLVSLPADIVAELLKAPAEALGLKKSGLEAETAYLNAVQSNVDAQAKLADTCRDAPEACPTSAYKLIRIQLTEPTDAGAVAGAIGSDGGGQVPGAGSMPPPVRIIGN